MNFRPSVPEERSVTSPKADIKTRNVMLVSSPIKVNLKGIYTKFTPEFSYYSTQNESVVAANRPLLAENS